MLKLPRLKKSTAKKIITKLMMSKKGKDSIKEKRLKKLSKKRLKKQKHREQMIGMFGKLRYYLAMWLGPWVLYTCNKKFYTCQLQSEPEPIQELPKEKKPAKVVALPQKEAVCKFCQGENIYIQGAKHIIPCPTCKRNMDKVKVAK